MGNGNEQELEIHGKDEAVGAMELEGVEVVDNV